MKRLFEVEVERIDRYTIEIDDEVMDEKFMERFNETFYEFDDLGRHAEHIAQLRARFHNDSIYGGNYEGYGDIAMRGMIKEGSTFPFPAINIIKADEDNEVETSWREVTKEDSK